MKFLLSKEAVIEAVRALVAEKSVGMLDTFSVSDITAVSAEEETPFQAIRVSLEPTPQTPTKPKMTERQTETGQRMRLVAVNGERTIA